MPETKPVRRCGAYVFPRRLKDAINCMRCVLKEGHAGSHTAWYLEGWTNEEAQAEAMYEYEGVMYMGVKDVNVADVVPECRDKEV